jgi:hypothetical protein
MTKEVDISLTVHGRAVLKIVKSMCNGIKNQIYDMKCHTNVNSTPPAELPLLLPHKFSYIVAYLSTIILNHPILSKNTLSSFKFFHNVDYHH